MGLEPWCFCPDNRESVTWALECGAKLLTCNNPLPALEILKEKGLHPRQIRRPL